MILNPTTWTCCGAYECVCPVPEGDYADLFNPYHHEDQEAA